MRSHNLVPIILLWLLLVAVLPLRARAYDALDDILPSSTSNLVHMFWVDSTKHDSYGLTYPVTYEFSIPDGSSGLEAYKRFSLVENWVQIVEKTSDNLFNGVEAARFDYANSRVYVSVAFGADSDFVYLCFKDSSGSEVVSSFIGTTNYYDNREVAVTFTIDDVGIRAPYGGNENFTKASIAFADAKVWWTAGWTTEARISVELIEEGILQEGINRGYLEIAAHSRTHPSTPYDDYDSEIGGCKDDIISNLDLPYKKGSQEYVWCWIEPSGLSDDMVQRKLGEYNYLVSRDDIQIYGPTYYEEWNSEYGLYDRAMTTIYMDSNSLTEINDAFDVVYNVGGIYHPWGHVGKIGWESGMKGYEHIQYVGGKKDVWYVGFGYLYAYRYASQIVQCARAEDTTPPAILIISPENKTYPASDVPLTFTVSEPTSWIGYSLDGQMNVTVSGNATIVGLSDGIHTITVYTNDTAGNMGYSDTICFTIDTVPPNIEILSPENKTYPVDNVPLTFIVDEATSWIGYSLDGQANATITGNTTLTGLLDGSHYVVVYANDTAGNMGASSTVYFTVDTTPPNITDVSQIRLENNVQPEDEVKVNATVIDVIGGVERVALNYTNGNGTWVIIEMTSLSVHANVWSAIIPSFPYGTNVTYGIIAEDNMNNTITTEDLGYEYQYTVIPEFPSLIFLPLFMIATLLAVIVYKRKHSIN